MGEDSATAPDPGALMGEWAGPSPSEIAFEVLDLARAPSAPPHSVHEHACLFVKPPGGSVLAGAGARRRSALGERPMNVIPKHETVPDDSPSPTARAVQSSGNHGTAGELDLDADDGAALGQFGRDWLDVGPHVGRVCTVGNPKSREQIGRCRRLRETPIRWPPRRLTPKPQQSPKLRADPTDGDAASK